ncbi:hypothetical protein [Sorangium sp. So ce887]|uniref:hypothetical protein n=1 Tax=Sorangium sp. So ce887 TaxID=3133324 RepID=UPI003F629DC7
MTQNVNKVRPGDRITADYVNNLVDTIAALDARLQRLEAGATTTVPRPVILATSPADQIQAGAPIQVIGQNFSPGTDLVTFAGFSIDHLDPGSGPSLLFFTTPTITFAGPPKDVFVTVRNQAGTASWPLKLLSTPQVAHGTSTFSSDGSLPTPGNLTKGGGPFTFGLLFQSLADAVESYTFSLVITNAVGTTTLQTWAQNAKLQDAVGNDLLTAGAVPVQPLQGLQGFALRLKLTIPATAGDDDTVSIAVKATATSNPAQLSKISDALPIKVGQSTVVSDPNILFTNTTQISVPSGSSNRVRRVTDGSTEIVEFPYKKPSGNAELGAVQITATFKKDSTAQYKIDPPGGPWLFDDALGWGPKTSTLKHTGETEILLVKLKLDQLAPADLSTHPELGSFKLTATRTNVADNTQTVSFTVVNIRGYAG